MRCIGVPVMTSTPKQASSTSSVAAAHGVSALASGPATTKPTRPPAARTAAGSWDGCGAPLAMCISPAAPSSSAAQPITARIVSELRSGCRRNRQASSAASTGASQASEPNPPTATLVMSCPTALSIRVHSAAASTTAAPRVSSPTPSLR